LEHDVHCLISIDIENHGLTVGVDSLIVQVTAGVIDCKTTQIVGITTLLVELQIRLVWNLVLGNNHEWLKLSVVLSDDDIGCF
jgi:hypothetical protein